MTKKHAKFPSWQRVNKHLLIDACQWAISSEFFLIDMIPLQSVELSLSGDLFYFYS